MYSKRRRVPAYGQPASNVARKQRKSMMSIVPEPSPLGGPLAGCLTPESLPSVCGRGELVDHLACAPVALAGVWITILAIRTHRHAPESVNGNEEWRLKGVTRRRISHVDQRLGTRREHNEAILETRRVIPHAIARYRFRRRLPIPDAQEHCGAGYPPLPPNTREWHVMWMGPRSYPRSRPHPPRAPPCPTGWPAARPRTAPRWSGRSRPAPGPPPRRSPRWPTCPRPWSGP